MFPVYVLTCALGKERIKPLLKVLSSLKITPIIYHNDDVDLNNISIYPRPLTVNVCSKYRLEFPRNMSVGEYSCGKGHLSIWKQFIESKEPYALIFEDDAIVFKLDFEDQIKALVAKLPKFDVINFSARNKEIRHTAKWEKTSLGLHYKKHGDSDPLTNPLPWNSTNCYLISRDGAEKLVSTGDLLNKVPIDLYMWLYTDNTYITNEFLVRDMNMYTGAQYSIIKDWSVQDCKAIVNNPLDSFSNGEKILSLR